MFAETDLVCLLQAEQLPHNSPTLFTHQRQVFGKFTTSSIFVISEIWAIITGIMVDWVLRHICSVKMHVLMGFTLPMLLLMNSLRQQWGGWGRKKIRLEEFSMLTAEKCMLLL